MINNDNKDNNDYPMEHMTNVPVIWVIGPLAVQLFLAILTGTPIAFLWLRICLTVI